MIRRSTLLLALALAGAGCGRAQGIPDQDLGDLVLAPKEQTGPIDVTRAAKDPVELGRALARPYAFAVTALGRHTATVKATTVTVSPDQPEATLSESSLLELGEGRSFHGLYENSADLGREVLYVDAQPAGTMYLRPRYQRWHGRPAEAPEEPEHVRDSFVDELAATWDLLGPAAELTDRGMVTIAGRPGRKIAIAQAPRPAKLPAEPLAQRQWRETRVIEGVKGEIVLDTDSGAVLSGSLVGSVSFLRDGKRYTLKLDVASSVSGVGTAVPIIAPDPGEVVATPERLHEVDDRDLLLDGLAPPTHRPAGVTTDPSPPASPPASGSAARGSGSAAP